MRFGSWADYRNNVAHSWPVGSFFQRVKWQEGTVTDIVTSPEELAAMIDLATQLISQLDFLPRHLGPEAVGLVERRHRYGGPGRLEVGFPVGAAVACSPASCITTAYAGGRGSRRTHRPVP